MSRISTVLSKGKLKKPFLEAAEMDNSHPNRGHLGYRRVGAVDTGFSSFCLLAARLGESAGALSQRSQLIGKCTRHLIKF